MFGFTVQSLWKCMIIMFSLHWKQTHHHCGPTQGCWQCWCCCWSCLPYPTLEERRGSRWQQSSCPREMGPTVQSGSLGLMMDPFAQWSPSPFHLNEGISAKHVRKTKQSMQDEMRQRCARLMRRSIMPVKNGQRLGWTTKKNGCGAVRVSAANVMVSQRTCALVWFFSNNEIHMGTWFFKQNLWKTKSTTQCTHPQPLPWWFWNMQTCLCVD